MFTSLAKEANFGYAVLAGPQAPSVAELPTPWLGWSCRHPRRRAGRGPYCHGARAEVVAAIGEPLVQRWSPSLAKPPAAPATVHPTLWL
jgi:hypothetical protein